MRLLNIRRFAVIIAFCLTTFNSFAQSPASFKEVKPYKILTSGKQITVKSTKNIKSIMVWTASGHRVVEQREINATSFSFNANFGEKLFFVMIQYEGSKPFTEKIGVQ